MEVSMVYTLKDGSTFNTKQEVLKHLDNEVSNASRRVAELFARKNVTEIMCEVGFNGASLMHDFVKADLYFEEVRRKISDYSIEDKATLNEYDLI